MGYAKSSIPLILSASPEGEKEFIMIKITAIGNLASDAVLRTFTAQDGSQHAYLSGRIISSERRGQNNVSTGLSFTVYNENRAKALAQYLKKGTSVAISGDYRERRSNSQNGQVSYFPFVDVDSVEFIGSRQNGQHQNPQAQPYAPQGFQQPVQQPQYAPQNPQPAPQYAAQPEPVQEPSVGPEDFPEGDLPF